MVKIPSSVLDLQVFLALDYSQIEIRQLAELSGDKLLAKQFNSGVDIHCAVGHALTGWPVERIAKDKETRKAIKNFHFGLVYGISKQGIYDYLISKGVKISQAKSAKYYDRYFSTYTGVRRFIDEQRRKAEKDGYVENLFGFRREISQDDDSRGTYWGNQAVNTPVQGTAHHLLLIALALLLKKPKTYNYLQRPVMEVHDAVYWFTKLRHLQEAFKQAKHLMEVGVVSSVFSRFQYKLKIPLIAEASAGFCLGSMVDYAGEPIEDFLRAWKVKHAATESPEAWLKLLPESVQLGGRKNGTQG